jgi:hypothetical protein
MTLDQGAYAWVELAFRFENGHGQLLAKAVSDVSVAGKTCCQPPSRGEAANIMLTRLE